MLVVKKQQTNKWKTTQKAKDFEGFHSEGKNRHGGTNLKFVLNWHYKQVDLIWIYIWTILDYALSKLSSWIILFFVR